jgi:hypothetical protein
MKFTVLIHTNGKQILGALVSKNSFGSLPPATTTHSRALTLTGRSFFDG